MYNKNLECDRQLKDMDLQMMLNRNDVVQMDLEKARLINQGLTDEGVELSERRDFLRQEERSLVSSNDQMNQQIERLAMNCSRKF